MSEYDQMVGHQVNSSGNCVISGCPCRGWSAQEGATTATGPSIECQFCDFKGTLAEGAEHRKRTMHLIRTVTVGDLRRSQSSNEHQPAARGGGDEWRYVETTCSAEIHVGQITLRPHWTGLADGNEIRALFQQIVTEHNAHHSLVAEREGLRAAIEVAIHNLNAGNDPRFLADYLRLTLDQKRGAR